MHSKCMFLSTTIREPYDLAPLFASHHFSYPTGVQLSGHVRLPTSPGVFEFCFCAFSSCFFFLDGHTHFIRMNLVIMEGISAQISLCKRRELLVHMNVRSMEPASESIIITVRYISGFLSFSLPLLPIPSPIPQPLKASVSPIMSKLPSCRE